MRKANSGLFLLEMILVILFFSLTAAVYVRLFATAFQTGDASRNLTQAVMISQNLAEAFYANGGDEAAMRSLFPDAHVSGDTAGDEYASGFLLSYDEDWNAMHTVPAEGGRITGAFLASMYVRDRTHFRDAESEIVRYAPAETDNGWATVYSLSLTRYTPGTQEE